MAYDTGILSRALQGVDNNGVSGQDPYGSYLSKFNVDPYWQKYLQNPQAGILGGQQGGLLSMPTGGANNPFNAAPPPAPAEAAKPVSNPMFDGVTISDVFGTTKAGRGGGITGGNVVLSNGMVVPYSMAKNFIQQGANQSGWDKLSGDAGALHNAFSGFNGGVGSSISAETLKALFGGGK